MNRARQEPNHPQSGSIQRIIKFACRLLILLAFAAAVAASLLAFTEWLPLVAVFWVAVGYVRIRLGRSVWPPAMILFSIMLIRNPEWSWSWLLMMAILLLVSIRSIMEPGKMSRKTENENEEGFGTRNNQPAIGIVLVVTAMLYCLDFWQASTGRVWPSPTKPIPVFCLGDSLTDYGYPQVLGRLITNPVHDFGQDGITSADGLAMLPKILDLRSQQPGAGPSGCLILELGGHDFNQGKSRSTTLENMNAIITACKKANVEVIVVEIPRGFVRDSFRGIERQLARKFDLQLVADTLIRKFVVYSNVCPPGTWLAAKDRLSNDGLHPNENGNKLFAETTARALRRIGLVN